MRRSWFQVLLFLVAITIQVIAPMAGNLAHAKGFSESGISSVLCQSPDGSSGQGNGFPNHLTTNKQCLLCLSVCDSHGFTLTHDQSSLVSANSWIAGVFPEPKDFWVLSRAVGLYRARAPPTQNP
jgi:prenyltransferase beta subunit